MFHQSEMVFLQSQRYRQPALHNMFTDIQRKHFLFEVAACPCIMSMAPLNIGGQNDGEQAIPWQISDQSHKLFVRTKAPISSCSCPQNLTKPETGKSSLKRATSLWNIGRKLNCNTCPEQGLVLAQSDFPRTSESEGFVQGESDIVQELDIVPILREWSQPGCGGAVLDPPPLCQQVARALARQAVRRWEKCL